MPGGTLIWLSVRLANGTIYSWDEAQAFGLPIVSFDCNTGPSDLIVHNENGYLVDCFDTEKLAEAIIKLIELDEEKYRFMCESAKQKNKEYYCEKIIKKWIDVIGN